MARFAAVLVAVVLAGSVFVFPGAAGAARTARPSVTIRIELDRTRVPAGTTIKGVAVVTNTTHHGVSLETCAANPWLAVGLTDSKVVYVPASGLVGCSKKLILAPGSRRFPISVITTYDDCAQTTAPSAVAEPLCLESLGSSTRNIMPPLPTGRYSTKVLTVGLFHNPFVLNRVLVTLLPAHA
jgi:hypothetical protein